jgi:hypothetical protein
LRGQETPKDSQPRLRPSIQPRPRSASVGLQDEPRCKERLQLEQLKPIVRPAPCLNFEELAEVNRACLTRNGTVAQADGYPAARADADTVKLGLRL